MSSAKAPLRAVRGEGKGRREGEKGGSKGRQLSGDETRGWSGYLLNSKACDGQYILSVCNGNHWLYTHVETQGPHGLAPYAPPTHQCASVTAPGNSLLVLNISVLATSWMREGGGGAGYKLDEGGRRKGRLQAG